MTQPTIAIVGGGASGAVLALQILEQSPGGVSLLLFEAEGPLGRGLAYGTEDTAHLLNVPAGRMSVWPSRPDDFVAWLTARRWYDPETPELALKDSFVPRYLYGDYVADRLRDRGTADRLRVLPRRVVDLCTAGDGYRLLDETGSEHEVEAVVLALGNQSRASSERPGVVPDPWSREALEGLAPEASVLLLGSGLTAVDLTLTLLDQRHRGPIRLLSRRGLLPRVHCEQHAWPPWLDPTARPQGLSTLLWIARREVQAAARAGVPWQAVIDALRPDTQALWLDLTRDERRRFLRHLRPWWDAHRHRMAPRSAARLAEAKAGGGFEVLAGKLLAVEPEDGNVTLRWRPRHRSEEQSLQVQRVIDCTGGEADPRRLSDPLVATLLRRCIGRADAHGLGLDVDRSCRLLDQEGRPMRRLYALGPLTRATFWEVTAMPDIRVQAARLAERLVEELAAVPAVAPPTFAPRSASQLR